MTTSTSTAKTPAKRATATKATAKAAADSAATTAPVLVTVDLVFAKETKGAVKYDEVTPAEGVEAKIGSLYLRKAHLDGKMPSGIRVTVQDLTDQG
jgi:hypothetical protein